MTMPPPVTFSQFHQLGFEWSNVRRVLVLPAYNGTEFTRAGNEVRQALAAELQNLGRFEIVSPPSDHPVFLAEQIHIHGRFDEAAMLALGREFSADVVVHVALTQYSPYSRPRVGLVVQAVSPVDGKVVASVDGLWDAASDHTAQRARDFYRSPQASRLQQFLRPETVPVDARTDDLVLDSPALFQRFVTHEVTANLIGAETPPDAFADQFTPLPLPNSPPTPTR